MNEQTQTNNQVQVEQPPQEQIQPMQQPSVQYQPIQQAAPLTAQYQQTPQTQYQQPVIQQPQVQYQPTPQVQYQHPQMQYQPTPQVQYQQPVIQQPIQQDANPSAPTESIACAVISLICGLLQLVLSIIQAIYHAKADYEQLKIIGQYNRNIFMQSLINKREMLIGFSFWEILIAGAAVLTGTLALKNSRGRGMAATGIMLAVISYYIYTMFFNIFCNMSQLSQ